MFGGEHMIAILNVSGERTTGSVPLYGVVLEVHAENARGSRAWRRAFERYETHNPHQIAIGEVTDEARVGERVKYAPTCLYSDEAAS